MKAPDFAYSKIIMSPAHFGSGPGSGQFSNNIRALGSYTDLLLTSNTEANCLRPSPLGDQFFLKTNATCKHPDNGEEISRYIYVSHQPEESSANDPLGSSEDYEKGMQLNGLIPGILTNMGRLDIFGIFTAFAADGTPPCVEVTLSSTRNLPGDICSNTNSHAEYATHFISTEDARKVDPCSFRNGQNTHGDNGTRYCKYNTPENFQNMASIPNDPLVYLYYTLFGAMGVHLLYCFLKKQQGMR
jgi:hypothetical protein